VIKDLDPFVEGWVDRRLEQGGAIEVEREVEETPGCQQLEKRGQGGGDFHEVEESVGDQ